MFKEFRKKLAISLNVLLGIQIALFGLGANVGTAHAASSLKLTTNLETVQFVAGEVTEFTVNLNNVNGHDYESIIAEFGITDIKQEEIVLEYQDKNTEDWLSLPTYQEGDDLIGMFGPIEGFPVNSQYDETSKFRATISEPGNYEVSFLVTDLETANFTKLTEDIIVEENSKLSTTLPGIVKDYRLDNEGNSLPYEFEVTLDNTYGYDRTNILGKFEIDNVTLENLETLDYWETAIPTPAWKSLKNVLKLNEAGTGLEGTFGPSTGFPTPPNVYNPETTATSKFRVNLKNTTVGTVQSYPVKFSIIDLNDEEYKLEVEKTIISDGKAPEVKMTVVPTVANDASKYTEVVFTADEEFVLKSKHVIFEQVDGFPTLLTASKVDNKIVVAIPEGSFKVQGDIKVTATFADMLDNDYSFVETIKTDVKVPENVTEVSAIVNEDGKVLVTWKNPVIEEDYKEIRIYRNGETSPLAILPLTATSYLDTTVEAGQTYYYDIAIVDMAGNVSETPSVTVTTPAPVVAAVASDSQVITPAPKQEVKAAEQEVKAETTENKVEENKEEDKLPLWGLIVLLVLAGVGGYLYFSKEDVKNSKPIAHKTSAAKSTPKKKSVKKTKK